MKLIVTILVCIILPQLADAQIDEKKREFALFEVTRNGASAVYTDVHAIEQPFDERSSDRIAAEIMEKEGVFGFERLDEGKTLRIFHMDYIEVEGIKSFILPFTENFYTEEPVSFEF